MMMSGYQKPLPPGWSRTERQFLDMKMTIEEKKLVVKSTYSFAIRVKEKLEWPFIEGGYHVSIEEWFKAIIVWDKDGIEIVNLPNIKEKSWWKDYVEPGKLLEDGVFEVVLSAPHERKR
ncbi:hypothetical protein H2200_002478 [Cladophialophora chaetospira]|uniref:Uncharacterized protein n=1 Tax=Cladophialophora chaetospira TaxID=386627 RepID=A0AA38XIZ1_9EURO|nr:hypothetical protein H2200_002478 [Cladophialophora chaetospira]